MWLFQVGDPTGKGVKVQGAFLEGSQHYYYSVWKYIYFPQNPVTFKSKK